MTLKREDDHDSHTSNCCGFHFRTTYHGNRSQRASATDIVSTTGSDANTASLCSAANPCRSFGAALSVTNTNGEIIALTTGGYGPMTIKQSVSIISPDGIYAGITASSGEAVTINAPGEVVVLRGLNINRQGTGNIGIHVTAVGVLHVERCVVSGFASDGIRANLTASAEIFIKETISRNNGGNGLLIIGPTGSGTAAQVSMVNTRSEGNGGNGFSFQRNVAGTLDPVPLVGQQR